jgi:hypothetical protein
MDISSILLKIRPNEEWSLSGDDYNTLIWHSDTNKPTLEEIKAGEVLLVDEQIAKAEQKAAILERLGLTEDELKVVLS